MSLSSGFYDSLNHDRKYFASEFARLFDGIILDGIFQTVGTCFFVEAYEGLTVNVGVGLAWFNHTWTYNDAVLPINGIQSEVLLDRIDALVLEVNGEDSVRDNRIYFKRGTASSTPQKPEMIRSTMVNEYPLCYIYRHAGDDEIRQADMENMIGTDPCPFVSGILKTITIDQVLPQWRDELNRFIEDEEFRASEMFAALKESIIVNKEALDAWIASQKTSMVTWMDSEKNEFLAWFLDIKGQLEADAAGNLQNQINRDEIEKILMLGFADGNKEFSDDGTVITSVDSRGRKLVKTFTDGFLKCTTELTSSTGSFLGSMTKIFSEDGKTISTEMTIL